MQSKNCDIAVNPTSCGDFEVNLKPNTNYTNVITNIQFTLKWPENTVNLTNFYSDFEVTLQGSVEEDDGYSCIPETEKQGFPNRKACAQLSPLLAN